MWQIEIRDNSAKYGGEIPGKLRRRYLSKLPDANGVNSLERFAIMSRLPSKTEMAAMMERKISISSHVRRTQTLRERYGKNVVAFPDYITKAINQ